MSATVALEDFKKLDIRIGTIVKAERVPDADKLVKLTIDLGDETRHLVAGIAEFFPNLDKLIDRQIPVLVNLEPRTFRGETSHGMMLAADVEGTPVLLHPEHEVPTGSIVR